MHINRSSFGFARRAAAFTFLLAGTASLTQAQIQGQQSAASPSATVPSAANTPFFLASDSVPADLLTSTSATSPSSSSSASSSSLSSAAASGEGLSLSSAASDGSQPPPRRRYGRPNYSDSHSNPDGSSKYTFMAGGGLTLPTGDTHFHETPSYGIQVGGGRNFNKSVGVLLQFDYDRFGLQGSTLANQTYVYDYGCGSVAIAAGTCGVSSLDGNNHVWSFTLNPTYTLATEGSLGAYAVVGGGFYHKVTDFTEPGTGEYCDPYYGCYQYTANQTIDHYTSNAGGVNAGIGLTYKFSKFSNERFYMEGRYVVVFNQQRTGLTAFNVGTPFGASYGGYDYYPANSNRTTYVPIKFGIRF